MKKKVGLRRRCSLCEVVGVVGKDIFWMPDPYDQDVHDRTWYRWLHLDCAHEIAMDI